MPKLPAVTPKKLIKVLHQLGFVFHRSKGSHLSFVNPANRRYVVVPFHNRELPKGTLLNILHQANISKEELTSLL